MAIPTFLSHFNLPTSLSLLILPIYDLKLWSTCSLTFEWSFYSLSRGHTQLNTNINASLTCQQTRVSRFLHRLAVLSSILLLPVTPDSALLQTGFLGLFFSSSFHFSYHTFPFSFFPSLQFMIMVSAGPDVNELTL